MKGGSSRKAAGFLLMCALWAPSVTAQQAAAGGELQAQVDALRRQVQAMQKDLDEIKALLAPLRARQAPTVPANLVIDLGDRPVKGGPGAKLTFIELTDYQ
jgi:hypothetical protein